MVTMTLHSLLKQKKQYNEQWPGGQPSMPRGVFLAYRHLLTEIKAAGKRAQGTLPGVDMRPVAPSEQCRLL